MSRIVLVVDDMPVNRQILKKILSDHYEVVEAASGEEAIDILRRRYKTVSAVLLDIVMPGMDGYAVLKHMRENAYLAQIPVIILTGFEDETSRVKALGLGANDFVTKPYNAELIKHCVRNNIRMRESSAIMNSIQRDKLTGLYTRETFFEKAAAMLREHEAGYYIMSCFDVNGFKVINDQYGTMKGDEVLKHIASTFSEGFTKHGGICGRIMADNFAVMYPASFAESREIEGIRREACAIDWLVYPITFCIGRYVVDDLAITPSAMYDRAALAETNIKGRYGKSIAVYDESMRRHLLHEQEITTEMTTALRSGQFEVWFQPQYNHSTGALIGAEALVRWRHPVRGLIPPNEFVPIFEKNGFVYEMDKFVWESVCKNLRRWLDEGRNPLPVSINISRFDILHEEIVGLVIGDLKKYKLPVELLRLEITESAFARDTAQIISVVEKFINYGFTVEIDDFGSGYSSLNTLKDVPAQVLKLDMRFLQSTTNSQRGGNIVESIVRMAKWLGMSVIAEGVETLEQADFLKSIGCCYMQGYFYSKPIPLCEYEKLGKMADKEERLIALETVENLDNDSFWDPGSIDTLIFSSFVGGACIFEYCNGKIELIRATDKYAQVIGSAGMTVEDALRLDWAEHVDAETAARIHTELMRSYETKDEVVDEYIFRDLPGCPRETYLRSTMRVIASTGDRYLVYCTNENMTGQRIAEQEKREAELERENAAKRLLDNLPYGAALYKYDRKSLHAVHINQRYWELMNRNKGESGHAYVTDAVHPQDRQTVVNELCAAVNEGREAVCDIRIRYGEGEYRLFHVVGRIIPDADGTFSIYALYTPIPDNALTYREIMPVVLSAIMEASSELSFVKDRNLNYICASRPFAKLVGLASEFDVVGKTDRDLFPREIADKYIRDDETLFSCGKSMIDMVEYIPSEDGVPHYSSTSKHILRDTTGSIVGLYGTGRDITEGRDTYQRLRFLLGCVDGGLATYACTRDSIRMIYASEAMGRLSGYTREEYSALAREDQLFAVVREDIGMIYDSLFALIDGSASVSLDFRVTTKAGAVRWLNLRCALAERHGGMVTVNAVFFDAGQRHGADLS